tara:strand:+ start:89 stop:565 length:477 start_codon:yes stop_codon:yes gene_type:complete
MNYKFLIITLILTLSLKVNSQSSTEKQSSERKIDREMQEYFETLKDEGYAPKFDDDKDIAFKIEGKWYYILRPDYENSFSLLRQYKNSHGCDNEKGLQASHHASRSARYAKAYMTSDCKNFIIRANLYNNGADVDVLVIKAIQAVKYCESIFLEKYNE